MTLYTQSSRHRRIGNKCGLRDYGLPPTDWPAVTFTPAAGLPPLTIEPMTCCLGLEPEPWAFVGHLVMVFREVRRVLRGDGTCWVNLGDSYANDDKWGGSTGGKHAAGLHGNTGIGRRKVNSGLKPKDLIGIPWMCAKALQADGWWLRSDVIWSKPNPMPESVTDRPTKAHEYVFLMAKSARYFYDAEAVREALKSDPATWGRHSKKDPGLAAPNARPMFGPDRNGRDGTEWGDGKGRNRRTVWEIATQPYAGAHFATFPTALVEPCLLASTSARGVCPACGAPWARVVERTPMEIKRTNNHPPELRTRTSGTMTKPPTSTTTGWRPTCAHAGDPQPATVLDPFFGSGTTGAVAVKCGRHYVGIELSEEYIKLARRRLAGAQPALIAKGLE